MKSVDLGKVSEFFTCSLGRRAAAAARAGKLKREKPFTLRTERQGREMLVQGVIDCCFEEDGKMILIDYKSSFIRPGRALDAEIERIKHEYAVQIELYSEAVFKGTGMEVGEAYLYLFGPAIAVRMK
jgi:ATP-dependent helicase/nuclease subunit A